MGLFGAIRIEEFLESDDFVNDLCGTLNRYAEYEFITPDDLRSADWFSTLDFMDKAIIFGGRWSIEYDNSEETENFNRDTGEADHQVYMTLYRRYEKNNMLRVRSLVTLGFKREGGTDLIADVTLNSNRQLLLKYLREEKLRRRSGGHEEVLDI